MICSKRRADSGGQPACWCCHEGVAGSTEPRAAKAVPASPTNPSNTSTHSPHLRSAGVGGTAWWSCPSAHAPPASTPAVGQRKQGTVRQAEGCHPACCARCAEVGRAAFLTVPSTAAMPWHAPKTHLLLAAAVLQRPLRCRAVCPLPGHSLKPIGIACGHAIPGKTAKQAQWGIWAGVLSRRQLGLGRRAAIGCPTLQWQLVHPAVQAAAVRSLTTAWERPGAGS